MLQFQCAIIYLRIKNINIPLWNSGVLRICAANLGKGSMRGPSRSLVVLFGGSPGGNSGFSSQSGVPGLDPPCSDPSECSAYNY